MVRFRVVVIRVNAKQCFLRIPESKVTSCWAIGAKILSPAIVPFFLRMVEETLQVYSVMTVMKESPEQTWVTARPPNHECLLDAKEAREVQSTSTNPCSNTSVESEGDMCQLQQCTEHFEVLLS